MVNAGSLQATGLLLLLCAAFGLPTGAGAQEVHGNVESRGVIILKPTASSQSASSSTPAPAPPVTPAPVVAPAPAPVVHSTPIVPPPAPQPVIKSCPRPFDHPDMSLAAGARFDQKLRSRLLARKESVVVDVDKPFALGAEPPALLAPWLKEVKASEGIVSVDQYCQQGRGFLSFLNKLFTGSVENRYAAAAKYDAVLHVDGLDQVVTQVEFRLRVPR